MRKGQKLKVEKPKQYLQGWAEFYKLKFFINENALIPRSETELLVDEILRIKPKTVLDLGTGSGCVAIAVAKNASQVKIVATDVSEEALEVARKNAKFHKVEDQIFFLKSDLLELWYDRLVYFPRKELVHHTKLKMPDIIVANLPYIPTARLMYIDPMVTEFEPRVALDGGKDGFELYRKLFAQIAEKKLFPKYLIGEIDYTHGELAVQEALRYFPQASVEIKHDLSKKQRYFVIKF